MSQGFPSHIASAYDAQHSSLNDVDPPHAVRPGNVAATLAVVFGGVALGLSWIPVVSLLTGAPLGIAAVVCGLLGLHRANRLQVGFIRAVLGLALGGVALLFDFMTALLALK